MVSHSGEYKKIYNKQDILVYRSKNLLLKILKLSGDYVQNINSLRIFRIVFLYCAETKIFF